MERKPLDITILCKVVDNFGDIGVTWRLAKHLAAIGNNSDNRKVSLRFVCSDLSSFSKINNKIDAKRNFQECGGVKIYDWNDSDFCYREFTENPPEIILECFQCGRPDWLEKILFDDQKINEQEIAVQKIDSKKNDNQKKFDNQKIDEKKIDGQKIAASSVHSIWCGEENKNRIVNIIMIDYLSAEKYQEDFHCLKSLTRSAKVQKVNFMPGFTEKTGGLLLSHKQSIFEARNENNPVPDHNSETERNYEKWLPKCVGEKKTSFDTFSVLFFAYKKDWSPVVRAMSRVFTVDTNVFVAAGQGRESILEAFEKCGADFHIMPLDFMNQEDWDEMMQKCNLLFVRGEDSLSQSCLQGVPFIWQAYPQSEEYQIVKVKALLERMRPHFGEEFRFVEAAWLSVNENNGFKKIESAVYDFLSRENELRAGFEAFAESLYKNGDLAKNLMTFIEENIIIRELSEKSVFGSSLY